MIPNCFITLNNLSWFSVNPNVSPLVALAAIANLLNAIRRPVPASVPLIPAFAKIANTAPKSVISTFNDAAYGPTYRKASAISFISWLDLFATLVNKSTVFIVSLNGIRNALNESITVLAIVSAVVPVASIPAIIGCVNCSICVLSKPARAPINMILATSLLVADAAIVAVCDIFVISASVASPAVAVTRNISACISAKLLILSPMPRVRKLSNW